MCRICADPLDELIELTELDCSGCDTLSAIPPELANLTALYCDGCPLLASIPPTLIHLAALYCSRCPLLASIPPTLTRLTTLSCSGCRLLASIPDTLANLTVLFCYHCPLLVSIPFARWTNCTGCPWLSQNAADYPGHIPSLLRLQRWFRTGKKQVFKRVIRTRAFNEFIYHPDRIGGRVTKRGIAASLDGMRKRQRLLE